MKLLLKQVEIALLGTPLIRWPVVAASGLVRRTLWLWGRLRFGALVRNRGLHCVCHWSVDLKYPENLTLGERVVIGVGCSIGAHSPITLGDDVRLSRDVHLETAGLDFNGNPPYPHISRPIVIDRGVWIGARASVLGGVHIGEYAVVAAGAMVTRDVPPRTVVAGVPARVTSKLSAGSLPDEKAEGAA